jgi:hypothetical protein
MVPDSMDDLPECIPECKTLNAFRMGRYFYITALAQTIHTLVGPLWASQPLKLKIQIQFKQSISI